MDLRQPAATELRFRACGRAVTASVYPASLADDVRRLFPAYALATSSACTREADLAVGSAPNGFEVRWNGRRETSGEWIDALIDVEAALAELLLGTCATELQLHAAGCAIDGDAVVVLGGPGAGKSSLTAAWATSGIPVLGDDVVLLDRRGWCHPFKRPIKVSAALLPVIGVHPATTLFWTPGAEEAWIDPAAVGGWAPPAPPVVMAVVRYRTGAPCVVRDLGRAELLRGLLHGVFPSGRPASHVFEILADAVQRSRAVEVEFGSAVEAARALVALA